jgi:uncharacterized membrane protein YdjX (TVP38/TMEM64 family)
MERSPRRRPLAEKSPPPSREGSGRPGLSGWKPWLVILGVVALATVLILWGRPLVHLLADVQGVRRFVASFGVWAPLAFISLEVAQVVLAPVPGGVIDLASGYLFGPAWGTLYSMTGLMGGTVIALCLARRFGRPWVERFVPSRALDRLDRYARHRGALFFLLLFLMPFTPNDVACFLAGLTPLPLRMLILIAAIGRLPGVLTANLMGASVATLTPLQLLLIGVPLILVALSLWRSQERVEEFLLRLLARLDELIGR